MVPPRNLYWPDKVTSLLMKKKWIECILSKLADGTKVSGAAGVLKGQGTAQRGLDRFENWDNVNLMKFNHIQLI